MMENPVKMDDLGVPLFLETPNINLPRCHEWIWMGLVEERFPVEYAAWPMDLKDFFKE